MEAVKTELPEVLVITPKRHGDHRGFFSEVFSKRELAKVGITHDFVQDNHSMSAEKNVVRGLHYQIEPMAQAKLLRVISGAILDVVVDVRGGSKTFGKHIAEVISAENWKQVYVPVGFAHGFVTLEPATQVIYKVSNYYSPQHERGIAWNDSDLKINWGIKESDAILSDRDRKHPKLSNAKEIF